MTSLGTIADLRHGVATEFRRVVGPPWDVPMVLLTNAALMIAGWFLLPDRAHEFLFSLNGPLAFPIVLASWMLSDTPATNVLGSNPSVALSVVADRTAYWRWLAARCVVLGTLVGVPCGIVVIIIGAGSYPLSGVLWAGAVVLLLPFGVLPISAWLGILLPYHPRSLRWRWQHRRSWFRHVRWAVLVLAPFVYVPLIGAAILSPAVALGNSIRVPGQRLSAQQFGVVAAAACGTVGLAAAIGVRGARFLLELRAGRLADYLSSPDFG